MNVKVYKGQQWAQLPVATGNGDGGNGRKVFIRVDQMDKYKDALKASRTNFHQLYFCNQVNRLKSSGVLESFVHKFKNSVRALKLEGGRIVYDINSGDVFITDIQITGKFAQANTISTAGCFKVRKTDDISWRVESTPTESGYIDTKHAAINGKAEGIQHAADYMPSFISRGYGDNALNNAYNLFYIPNTGLGGEWQALRDGSGIGASQAAQKLADALTLTANRGNDTCWTVHERGHSTFKRALKLLAGRGVNLSNQTVFYANPTENIELVDRYRKKTGMKLAARPMLINDISLRQTWLSGNAFSASAVSLQHIKEQGEDGNLGRTKVDETSRFLSRMAVPATLATPPVIAMGGALGLAGWTITAALWSLSAIAVVGSNIRPGANAKVIENTPQAIRHLLGK